MGALQGQQRPRQQQVVPLWGLRLAVAGAELPVWAGLAVGVEWQQRRRAEAAVAAALGMDPWVSLQAGHWEAVLMAGGPAADQWV